MKKKLFTIIVLCLYIIVNTHPFAQSSSPVTKKVVYIFDLKQEISPAAFRLVKNALNEAVKANASLIIMRLNTYGGELTAADDIHALILNSTIPVYVLVEQNAASAGALISISCDSIYMKKGSTIGAASVVNQNGELMPDKYQSYMRGVMRATAQQRGRDPKIAEGMVTPNNYLKDIADTGKIITMTSTEALRYNYCSGQAENVEQLLQHAGIKQYQLVTYESNWVDALINFLMNPVVNSILLLMIMGGIYFEFQHPGLGIPLFMGLAAAVLYFAPLYIDGLATYWEILVFVVGLLLLLLELFVFPGHAIWGATGILLIIAGLTLSLVDNHNFDFSLVGVNAIVYAMFRVVVVLVIAITLALSFGRRFFDAPVMRKAVLTETMVHNKSFSESTKKLNSLIDATGIALTDLRPAGAVKINEEQYDAVGEGGYIHRGETVRVIEIRGNYLVVRKAETEV